MDISRRLSGNALTNFIATVSASGGLLFGYDTGIIASALLQLRERFHLSTGGAEIVTSAIILGALFGCLGASRVSDRFGRRRTVIAAAFLFLVGTVMISTAESVTMLITSRLLLGLAIGAASQIIPIYIAEISPPDRRGRLVVAFQLAVVTGMTISFLVGYFLRDSSWRLMFGLGMMPALILFFGMLFLPDSPRWLVMIGQTETARKILHRIRSTEAAAEKELTEIITMQDVQAPWSELFSARVRPATIASIGIALLCQLTGVNAVMYYAPAIFTDAGFGADSALLTSIAVGFAMMVATLFGGWAVDNWGRRSLLLWMTPGAVISLALLGTVFALHATSGIGAWITVAAVVGYTIFNVGSLSVGVWLVGAEVYPLSCRGKGMSLVAAGHWGADLVISLTTLSMVQAMGAGGTFWLFAVINAFAFIFILRYVPETKGQTLEELENRLKNGTFAPISRAQRKQMRQSAGK